MDQIPRTLRLDSETPPSRRGLPNRRVGYYCRHCHKQYTTSTWLDKHIKDKHSAESTLERSQSLADIINNRRGIANSALLLPQSSIPQELHHSSLIRDLQGMSSSLKRFLPLIDDLVTLLQEPNEVSSRAHSISQNHPRNLKRRASSQDVHEQNKRQGTSTSASDLSLLRTDDLMYWDDFESQDASPATSVGGGDLRGFDSSEYALCVAQNPSFEQVQEIRLPFSQQTALSSQALASEFPRKQRQSRPSRVPKTQSFTGKMFETFQRQPQGNLSPCEQLASYPHKTSPTGLATEWVPPESTGNMTRTPLQKSLDLLSHEPGQHLSPFVELQQSLDYLDPASQEDIGNAFGQTPQQDDFRYGLSVDPSDFLALPMQPGEALED